VRVRDHAVVSAAGAAVLSPWLGRRALALLAAGILIDADHYVWFALHHRRVSPVAAVRYFTSGEPKQNSATRLLHNPVVQLLALAIGLRRRSMLPVVAGMAMHVALDFHHQTKMEHARATALRRADFTCQRCGESEEPVRAHLSRQPWVLPSYDADNLVTLCARCHEAQHAGKRVARSRRGVHDLSGGAVGDR